MTAPGPAAGSLPRRVPLPVNVRLGARSAGQDRRDTGVLCMVSGRATPGAGAGLRVADPFARTL
jgi:hypothetical protein